LQAQATNFDVERGKIMTTNEKIISVRLAADLLAAVSTYHSPEIAASIVDHFGDFQRIGSMEQEEMMDDLISKLNDLD